MRSQRVVWTETHIVEVEAMNLAEAKRLVNEMKVKDLNANPTYTIDISGLPRDTAKK